MSDDELPDVETWLREHSRRPKDALALWPKLLAAADPRSGEVLLTRDELAAAIGTAPRTVSSIMTELERVKAIAREPHGRQVRYFIHPLRLGEAAGAAASQDEDAASGSDASFSPALLPPAGVPAAEEERASVEKAAARRSSPVSGRLAAAAIVLALAAGGWALWTDHATQAEIEELRQHAEDTRAAGERWRRRLAAIVAGPGEAAGHGRAEIEASLMALVADRLAAVERVGKAERNRQASMEEIASLQDRLDDAERALAAARTRHAGELAASQARIDALRLRSDAAARDARAKLVARDREIAALKKTHGNIRPGRKKAAARVEPAAVAAVYGPWTLQKGETLREVLERWTGTAGVELVYVTNRRYTLRTSWRASGTLEEAVQRLMTALDYLPSPPVATFAQHGRSLMLQHRLRKGAT